MTKLIINIPDTIELSEQDIIEPNKLPAIPAEKIVGVLSPDQIPQNMLVGGDAEELMAEHLANPDPHPQYLRSGAIGTAVQQHDSALDALMGASVQQLGRNLLEAETPADVQDLIGVRPDTTALHTSDLGQTVQPFDSDLAAIAALSTTPFGRALLTLADQAAARALLGVNQAGGATSADITAAINAHKQESDPHPNYATDSDVAAIAAALSAHFAAMGAGSHLPSGGITDALIATGAAIAWSKINKQGATPADIGAATAAQGALASTALQPAAIGNIIQPLSSILSAIAQLSTTNFGLGFLTQPDAANARAYIGAGTSSGTSTNFPKASAALTYTFSQSAVDSGYAGSYANLTDGSFSTGAACPSASPAWFQVDLGADYYLSRVEVGGGSLSGWGAISNYWSNNQVLISSDGSTWTYLRDAGFSVISDAALTRYALPYCLARFIKVQRIGYLGISTLNIYGFQ